jgi:hypothetical protein
LRGDITKRAILAVLARQGVYSERVRDLFVCLLQNSGAEFNAEALQRRKRGRGRQAILARVFGPELL